MQHLDILLTLIVVLVAARLAGMVSRRIGMPAVLGELLAGLIIGPSVLNLVHTSPTLDTVADIGVLLLLFIAGLETDLIQMKLVGKASTLTATGGVVLPLIGGTALGLAAGMNMAASLFLGVALTATSVSVSVQVLNEVGFLRSRFGMVIMGAAITDDVLGILVLSLILGLTGQGQELGWTLVRLVLFFPVAVVVGRFVLGPVMAWISRHHAREAGMALVLAVVFFYSWSAEAWAGLAAITGAYVAGVMISRVPESKEWVTNGAVALGQGLFIPVFFVTVGLHANFREALIAPVFVAALTAIAIVTKAIGAAWGARLGGCNWQEARVVGAGMIARGEVALVVAALGLDRGIIGPEVYTVVIIMTLATTLLTPLLLKLTLTPKLSADAPQQVPAYAPAAVEPDRA
jgi:Kef-type K+ transport system membrane component KefB